MTRSRLLASVAMVAATASIQMAYSKPAMAQQRSAQVSAGIEEIVVTARKRDENLKDVPLAISAFTEVAIEKAGIDNMTDLANQTPGFSFRQGFGRTGAGQGGAASRPSIRAQSNILGVANTGFFVDGIYVSGNITSYQLDNVERIEVIRGPQSALFGRGTFAGAVNFITRKPGDTFTGKIETTVAQNDRYEVNGYVSGPIIEGKVAGELNGRYYTFGGDWLNRATGKKEGGEESSRNVGGKLYFTPSDSFDAEVNVGLTKDVDGFYASGFLGVANLNCQLPTIVATVPFPRSSNRRTGAFCGEQEIPDTFYARTDLLDALGLDGVNRGAWRASAKANYEVNDWTLTGIAAYNKNRNASGFDSNFNQTEVRGRTTGLTYTESRRKDWSLEGRIDSPRDNTLRGLAGFYYYREDDGVGYTSVFTNPAGTAPVPIGSVIGFAKTPSQDDSAVRNWSVFSLLEFEASDNLSLTAEGRYQVDKIISDQAINRAENPLLDVEYKKFLPRATALYSLNEDWNVFANVAKGNKPGGFNSLPTDADAASRADLVANAQSFREESAWTYELGVKGANADRTITLSSSAYWIAWSNQQLTKGRTYTLVNGTFNTASLIQNAGQSRIRGLEIDMNAKPADALDFRLGYAYNKAEIRDFLDDEQEDLYDTDGLVGPLNRGNDPSGQTRGQRLPQTPAHQVILSGSFTQPLSGDWAGFIRSDLTYETKRYAQVDNLQHTGDSYLMNIRTGVENDALSVTLFVNNVLDDHTPAVITRLRDFSAFLQIPNRLAGKPATTTFFRDYNAAYPRKRSIGVTGRYKF